MDKHFKHQRSSLNISILNVRRNVLLLQDGYTTKHQPI